jgi:ankyrin repeat protein
MLHANPKLADDMEALCNAAREGNEPFVRLMLRYRPKLAKKVGVGGKTAAITELLFAHGMNANHRDWLEATPLHEFARRGDVMNASLFLAHGARVDVVDEDLGMTPLEVAVKFKRQEIVDLLGAVARG